MKATNKMLYTALGLAVLAASSWAESPASAAPAAKDAAAAPAPPTITAADVQSLNDALAAQQLQIQRLTQQLQAQQSAVQALSKTDSAPAQPVPQQQLAAVTSGAVVRQDGTGSALNLQDTQAP